MIGRSLIVITIAILITSILFRNKFDGLLESCKSLLQQYRRVNEVEGVYSTVQLAEYDGIKKDKLYLALLGVIYDVTEGKRHYEKGAPYNYFTGKDGSRAFITGEFNNEGPDRDHVLNLSCDQLFSLINWKDTLKEKYAYVGLLTGRYYDENGEETEYSKQVNNRMELCFLEKDLAKKQQQKLPPCNMEWNANEGTRVWCTKTSGGITRSWVGVPRQLYTPGADKPRCVCVNLDDFDSTDHLEMYENCIETATTCNVGLP